MGNYIVRRLGQSLVVLLGVTIVVFLIMQMIPGGAAMMLLGVEATAEQIAAVEAKLGLDRPLPVQYLSWLGGALTGDLGNSWQDGRLVWPALVSRLPATLELLAASLIFAIVIGVPVGVISAVKRNSWFDNLGRVAALVGVSMPSFWLGLVLILVFAKGLRWFPAAGREGLTSVVLPAVALGSIVAGLLMRMVRSSVLEVLREEYVRTARAKGLSERVVLMKHAFRTALLPSVTMIGLQIGHLLGGSVVIESVFAWPGIGRFTYIRMLQRDVPTIMGNLLIYATLFSLINLLTDLSYALLDPRIQYD